MYVLAGALMIGGLMAHTGAVALQGLELLLVGLVAADARGLRRHIPVLNSKDRAVAAGGWAILLLVAIALALLPEV